jgi:hypothetical protein
LSKENYPQYTGIIVGRNDDRDSPSAKGEQRPRWRGAKVWGSVVQIQEVKKTKGQARSIRLLTPGGTMHGCREHYEIKVAKM